MWKVKVKQCLSQGAIIEDCFHPDCRYKLLHFPVHLWSPLLTVWVCEKAGSLLLPLLSLLWFSVLARVRAVYCSLSVSFPASLFVCCLSFANIISYNLVTVSATVTVYTASDSYSTKLHTFMIDLVVLMKTSPVSEWGYRVGNFCPPCQA